MSFVKSLTVLWLSFVDFAYTSSSDLFGTGGLALADLIPSDFPMGANQYLQ